MKLFQQNFQLLLAIFFFFILGNSAYAHPGHFESGIITGFLHPFNGLDHFLAALALGVFANQSSNRIEFRLPLVFIFSLLVGGLFGYFFTKFPGVEFGIVLSLFVLAFAIMANQNIARNAKFGLAVLFGLFHGNAHGSEFVGSAFDFFNYIVAISLATAFLHAAGIFLVLTLKKYLSASHASRVLQVFGSIVFMVSLSLYLKI